ncbi:unnamed protein product [Lactuca virosa]|uniref:Uncharacterized protein n=1 Tax=Lactuca virosa TaxID=75947 RepID=A0AAU9PXC8_9ASTR|nr:unnamed protein product [Lactuca virosa]
MTIHNYIRKVGRFDETFNRAQQESYNPVRGGTNSEVYEEGPITSLFFGCNIRSSKHSTPTKTKHTQTQIRFLGSQTFLLNFPQTKRVSPQRHIDSPLSLSKLFLLRVDIITKFLLSRDASRFFILLTESFFFRCVSIESVGMQRLLNR